MSDDKARAVDLTIARDAKEIIGRDSWVKLSGPGDLTITIYWLHDGNYIVTDGETQQECAEFVQALHQFSHYRITRDRFEVL